MKNREGMEKMLATLCDEAIDYQTRLEAYEYLQEDCEEIVDAMLEKFYQSQGETADMLIEILSEYKGNKAIYMGLVSYLYRGDDVALYARLLGKYGDESAIEVLKSFAESTDLNYNEYMEIRNAVEELGGYTAALNAIRGEENTEVSLLIFRPEGGAYQSFRDIEPADAAQGILDKAGLPNELAGIGQALPRTAAAGIGMRARSRALFRSRGKDFEKFRLAQTFLDSG